MCGRFVLLPKMQVDDKDDAVLEPFEARAANDLPDLPNYNICPTDQIHAVISSEGVRHIISMRWGFIPHWYKTPDGGPLLINARSETIAKKPAFSSAARQRRCLIPATGFYEWTKDADGKRLPWYIHRADHKPIVFAGVWQRWERDGESHSTCAIVTTGANRKMQAIHHRQPVTLEPEAYALWLGEAGHGAATLMTAAPEDALVFHRVGAEVNSNRAAGPDLIEPVEA